MNAILRWAEAIGEQIGRHIALQLRPRIISPLPAPAREAPRVRRSRPAPAAQPRARGPGRPRRNTGVPIDQFAPGSVVEFRNGRRDATGSVLTIDADRSELTILDLGTNEVVTRRSWDLRLVKAAPVVVRRRRPPDAAVGASATATLTPAEQIKAAAVAEAVTAAAMDALTSGVPRPELIAKGRDGAGGTGN